MQDILHRRNPNAPVRFDINRLLALERSLKDEIGMLEFHHLTLKRGRENLCFALHVFCA